MRTRTVGAAVLLLTSFGACASATDPAIEGGQWIYDVTDAPPGAQFQSTEWHDPEYEDYEDNPVHRFAGEDLDADAVVEWYLGALADDGWRIEGADEHQLIASRFRAEELHVLRVETHNPDDDPFDSFTVEEYLAEE